MTLTQHRNQSAAASESRLEAVATVRRASQAIAAEAASAICGPDLTGPRVQQEHRRRALAVAEHTIARVLAIVEGRAAEPKPAEAGPRLEQVGTVRRFATAQAWHALLRAANGSERRLLLESAELVFGAEPDPETPPGAALFGTDARAALARALIRQEDAGPLAQAAGVRLANGYLVVAFATEPAEPADSPALPAASPSPATALRPDVLVTEEGGHTLALVPLACAVPRSRARAMAEQSLRAALRHVRHGVLALAQAVHRRAVAAAVDETTSVLQIVDLLGYPSGFYQLDDVPIEMSLVRSPDLANLLATRLAPLHGSGAPLLETLKVYLDTVQDRKETAKILHIHPNTLDYRLRRIRELTGLSPNAPRDIQTLGAALAAWILADVAGTTQMPARRDNAEESEA